MKKTVFVDTQLKNKYIIYPLLLSLLLVSINFFLFTLNMHQEAEVLFNESALDESLLPAAFQAFILYDEAPLYGVYKVLFPILSVMPGAFVYIKERQTGAWQYLILRRGKISYFRSRLFSAIVIPFLMTSITLILSAVIAHIFLPELGRCDYGYLQKMFENGRNIPFFIKGMFIRSPFTATITAAMSAGLFSALLSVLTMSVSFFLKSMEYAQVKLLLPAFLICFLLDIITDLHSRITGIYSPLHPVEAVGISFFPHERDIKWLLSGAVVVIILTAAALKTRSNQDEI